ncbi:hypothetical protein COCMIDRAFT_3990 [Bipolaris oryzae ATCC 44560]|uniref:Uncharacterized protein n=1 Tax=Bipolaris oryzae ATCC 44560 TaxID=930090 RepID=W6ZAI4_COCMI|nr:uncharacterized protein COCMIDRAFT_3990 [Bipolaris oryzae ATCC 44560]EUC46995.1 hypothetical protein COCMIDRAFT_3990 [Bipolaris oryzae ATCC 44560]
MPSSIHNQNEPLLPGKLANEREPMNARSDVVIKALALLRIGFGVSCLLAPRFTFGLFRIDVPAAYAVLPRLFGGREIMLGELLLTAGNNKLPDGGRREIKRALWAGIGADIIDFGCALFGSAIGTSSKASTALVAGGAVVSIIVGAVGMRGL